MSFKFFLQYCENIKNEPLLKKIKSLLTYFKIAFSDWTDYYLFPLILTFIILFILFFLKSVYQHDAIYDNLRLNKVKYKYEEFKKEMKYTKCYNYKILN